jgi:hypothetical protein
MMLAAGKDTNGGTYSMFKSFSRRTVKTIVVAIAGIAMVICASGASEAATVSKAAPSGITEKWVYIRTYSGAAPGEETYLCDQGGQAYINEGLASQYQCDLSSSGDKLYILTLAG